MSKMAMSALAPAQSALVRAMRRIRPADGGGVEDMLRRDLGRPAARAIITAIAMFSTMSGGAVSVPIGSDDVPASEITPHIRQALRDMDAKGLTGEETTPYLLGRIVEITSGRSLKASIALIRNNARMAARVAVADSAIG